MDRDDIATAAREQGLGAALAAFPDEIVAAFETTRAQCETLAAMFLGPPAAS